MNELLTKKFPVFRVYGIQVNVHILFLLFAAWELYNGRSHPGVSLLFLGVLWTSVLLHEFGHCWGARYQGGDAREVILWPLGGLAMCEIPQNAWANGFVAASGPAVNVVLGLVGFALSYVLPTSWAMYDAVGFDLAYVAEILFAVNLGLFLFNMLPAFPMDMGRIYQAVLWAWMGFRRSMRIACYTSMGVAAFLVLQSIAERFLPWSSIPFVSGTMTFFIAIWVAQEAYNELQRVNAGMYEELDEPWRQTFRYHPAQEPKEREPGFLQRWQQKREEQKQQKEADETAARAARLDEVLRQVAKVGMDGLTPEEKAFLEQESARLREKR